MRIQLQEGPVKAPTPGSTRCAQGSGSGASSFIPIAELASSPPAEPDGEPSADWLPDVSRLLRVRVASQPARARVRGGVTQRRRLSGDVLVHCHVGDASHLRVAGFATVEAMRRAVIAAVSAADLSRLHDAAGLPAEDGDVDRQAAG